jgi:hypothetical protein
MKNIQPKFVLVISAIALAAIFRLLPHWPNFTPVATIALMGGALISSRAISFIVPLIAMFISDVLTIQLINYRYITVSEYFSSEGTALIYVSILAITGIGFFLKKRRSIAALTIASTLSALVFFLLSNFGSWMTNSLPKTGAGLLATYEMGIPFFANNLAGNLFFTFVFFGALSFASQSNSKLLEERVK